MELNSKKFVLFFLTALVVASVAQFVVSKTYFSDEASDDAVAFAESSAELAATFGTPLRAKVVKRRNYGNPQAGFRRAQEFTLFITGTRAQGLVRIVSISGEPDYRVVETELHQAPTRRE